MARTVGSVPFLNARPLVAWFESLEVDSPVRVVYDLPSRLPALLDSGQADAILVSSIEALTVPGRKAVAGVCIGSRGSAESVRLFSKVPLHEIESLALDAGSMTSNALARIVLAETDGRRPTFKLMPPGLQSMLAECDAAVLIGDKGLLESTSGLEVLDLGKAWLELTGLPFVWALWVGADRLSTELADQLRFALGWAEAFSESVIEEAAARSGVEKSLARRYLAETMNYRLEDRDLAGLQAFGKLLVKHGISDSANLPEFVGQTGAVVT